jgi:hypothetical protein
MKTSPHISRRKTWLPSPKGPHSAAMQRARALLARWPRKLAALKGYLGPRMGGCWYPKNGCLNGELEVINHEKHRETMSWKWIRANPDSP